MDIWIARVGWYDDERVLGVADSPSGADALVMRARLNERFNSEDHDSFRVTGPYRLGEIYDWMGERV